MAGTAEEVGAAASATGTSRVIDCLARRGGQLRGGECVLRGTGRGRVQGSAVDGSPGLAARTVLVVHRRSCSAGSEAAAVQSSRRVAVRASAVHTGSSVQRELGSSTMPAARGCGTGRKGSRRRPSRGTEGSSSVRRGEGVVEGVAAVSVLARVGTVTASESSASSVVLRRRPRAEAVQGVAAAVLRGLAAPTSSVLLQRRQAHSVVAHGAAPPNLHHSTSPSQTRPAASV